jgi:hypothetical protein
MTLPTWSPDLADVGAYVTSRTLDNSVPGVDAPTGTFNEDTYPTDAQVTGIIPGACQWVLVKTGTVDTTLVEMAKACAALYTAATVELSFPQRDADVENAQALLDLATSMRVDLALANIEITGVDPSSPSDNLVPQYAFPDPIWWGDYNRLGS